jgi:hypothetical protein
MSRNAFSEPFNIMQELKNFDREPNWTEVREISDKYNISFDRVQLLATAMFHAGWKPSKMGRRIIEKLRIQKIKIALAHPAAS